MPITQYTSSTTLTSACVYMYKDDQTTVAALCLWVFDSLDVRVGTCIMWQTCDENRNYARVCVAQATLQNFFQFVHIIENKVATVVWPPITTDLRFRIHMSRVLSPLIWWTVSHGKPSKQFASGDQQNRNTYTIAVQISTPWHSSFTT